MEKYSAVFACKTRCGQGYDQSKKRYCPHVPLDESRLRHEIDSIGPYKFKVPRTSLGLERARHQLPSCRFDGLEHKLGNWEGNIDDSGHLERLLQMPNITIVSRTSDGRSYKVRCDGLGHDVGMCGTATVSLEGGSQ